MKTNPINTLARLCGLTVTMALLAGVSGIANAQEKGASKLLQLTATSVEPKSTSSDYKSMSCPKCKDTTVEVKENVATKGAGASTLLAGGVPTRLVSRHECGGCGNEWVVSGHGKATTVTAIHTCTSCGAKSLACCSTSSSGVAATKGMEKKFEVAPLK
jgi:ribosomal protein S27E